MNESTVFISESDVLSQNETVQRKALGNALIQQVSFPFFVILLKLIIDKFRGEVYWSTLVYRIDVQHVY